MAPLLFVRAQALFCSLAAALALQALLSPPSPLSSPRAAVRVLLIVVAHSAPVLLSWHFHHGGHPV